ncbi:hypothetical protein [Niallia taxi]|uniref:hypothetical protein n=1 Tax=Niallia taxi TaxID=2499688 RepID=UPI002E1D9911|nr:hypothetical protein [Niallia taxi]
MNETITTIKKIKIGLISLEFPVEKHFFPLLCEKMHLNYPPSINKHLSLKYAVFLHIAI